MSQSGIPENVSDEAIVWFARLRADNVSSTDRQNFFDWLRQGRVNQQAFVEILQLWEGLAVIADMNFEEIQGFPPLSDFKRKMEARP